MTDLHRPLTPQLELASILSHVEARVVMSDYTFSFGGRRYQIARRQILAGMRGQRVRVELRLDGTVHARHEGNWLDVCECGARAATAPASGLRKHVRKDHNAGGKSGWMEGFFEQPGPSLWQSIRAANRKN